MGCPLTIGARTSGRNLNENDQRVQVDCQNLLSTGLLPVVLTSCNKWQVAASLILTDLLQLDEIDKFVATC